MKRILLAVLLVLSACSSVPLGTARSSLTISEQDADEFLNRAGPGRGDFSLPGGKHASCGNKGCILKWKTQPPLFDGDRAVGSTAAVKGQVALTVEDLTKLKRLILRSRKNPILVEDLGWKLTCVRGFCEMDTPYPLRPQDAPPSERRTGEAFRGLVLMSENAGVY